jgi:hypothetical protein
LLIVSDGDEEDDWYIGGLWTGLDWLESDLLDEQWIDDAIKAVRAVWRDDEIDSIPARYMVD